MITTKLNARLVNGDGISKSVPSREFDIRTFMRSKAATAKKLSAVSTRPGHD
jgi:hypothetical protein